MATAAAPQTSAVTRSEDILSAKTDLCLSNGIVKAGTGLAVGIVASAILFRRRPWPVFTGLGFGIGQGYSDCDRVFNPAAVPGFRIAGDAQASPFTLSSPFTAPPPSAPAPSTPAPVKQAKQATHSAADAAHTISSKVADAVAEAKQKASEVAAAASNKVVEAKNEISAKVVGEEKKAEEKITAITEGKKWV